MSDAGARPSGGTTFVVMVQATHMRDGGDWAVARRLDGPRDRCILVQRHVSPPLVVVDEIAPRVAAERAFVPDDHVVEALPADGADHPFDERMLPGRPRGGEDLLGPQASSRVAERLAVEAVPIADEETRGCVPRPRLTELLGGPDGGRVRGDVDVNDPSAIRGHDDEHEEHAEGRGGDGEDVDGSELGDVVGEKTRRSRSVRRRRSRRGA